MKLTENSDEIVVRHIPVREWIIGGTIIFVYSGFCIWLIYSAVSSSGTFYETGTKEWLGLFPFLIFTLTIIIVSIFDINLNIIDVRSADDCYYQ